MRNGMRIVAVVLMLAGIAVLTAWGQEPGKVTVSITPDKAKALYKCGEAATFTVTVSENGKALTEGEVVATFTRDQVERVDRKRATLGGEQAKVTGTLSQPGFMTCEAAFMKDGKVTKGAVTVGFDPEKIKPVVTEPADFDAFWQAGKAELAKVEMKVEVTPRPQESNDKQDAYEISITNIDNTKIYGYLNVPKGPGPFPAWISFPSAGGPVKPTSGFVEHAEMGAISLNMCMHDFDPSNPPADVVKDRSGYPWMGAPDRNKYYFRRAILGFDRAIEYLASRPDFDGKHLLAGGTSQGGGFALIMGGLNKRVTAVVAGVPALCDEEADMGGRRATWPNILALRDKRPKEWVEMARYFDAVNFAKRIKAPTLCFVGFDDDTCPPTSVYAAYNVISAPKCIFNGLHSGHVGSIPEIEGFQKPWIKGQLGLGPVVAFPAEK